MNIKDVNREEFYSKYLTLKYENYSAVVLIRYKDCYEAYEEDVLRIAFAAKRSPLRGENGELFICIQPSELDWFRQRIIRTGRKVIVLDYDYG